MKHLLEGLKRGFIGAVMASFASYAMLISSSLGATSVTLDVSLLLKHFLLYLVSGFVISALSVLFEIKHWSINRIILTHAAITLPVIPLAYLLKIVPSTFMGIGLFVVFYLLAYTLSYILYNKYKAQTA